MKKKKLHIIGNGHLDLVWLWNWQEGFQENKATFLSALERLKEYDDVIFTSSSAQCYRWVEENNYEMFLEIKKRIEEGRWVICGGWWVEPDCNIPSGESFARQGLLGQNYFYDKFGVTAKTGYCVDSFGHNGMLPQILKKSGMDNYVFMRPGPHEKELPNRTFLWEAPDGSQVKAFRLPFTYGTFGNLEEHFQKCKGEFREGIDHMMAFYGVGNHGGGPTIQNIESVKKMMKEEQDIEMVFSSPDSYFEDITQDNCILPVVKDDLQHHAAGSYSAQSSVKFMNRRSENALIAAEKYSVLSAALRKSKYPDGLDHAWELVLLNQFHDTLAGSAIESAYYDTRNDLGEAVAIAKRGENLAIQAISWDIDIPYEDGTLPVVVFNPHSWDVTAAVEFETGMFTNGICHEALKVSNSAGQEIDCQVIEPDCRVLGRRRIVFEAAVPALGYATYQLDAKTSPEKAGQTTAENVLENEILRLEFNKESGELISILDKKKKREYLAGAVEAAVYTDLEDAWGHELKKMDALEGKFSKISMKKLEEGPVRSTLRITSQYLSSTLTQTYTLYKHDPQIYVKASVNWQEHQKCLKINVPVLASDYKAYCEIPFGAIEKQCDGYEEPVQRWVDLSGKEYGMSVLNDGKYSASFQDYIIGMTILRSPVYAHHQPYQLQADEEYRYIDQGVQEFTYALLPHDGDWRSAQTVKRAAYLNQPFTVIVETFHKGSLPWTAGYMKVNSDHVILSALKKFRNSMETVLRVYETNGEETETEIQIFDTVIRTTMHPYEIKSFALGNGKSVREINLIEWDV